MNTQTATTAMKTTADLIAFVVSECTAIDREERYDRMLEDCYPETVEVCGMEMNALHVFKEMDPIAYRCGLNDFADGEGWIEIGGDSYDSDEVETAREQFIDGLRDELADLESEKEDFEEQVEEDSKLTFTDEIASLDTQIAAMESRVEELERYSF